MENKFVYATMNSSEKTEGKDSYTVGIAVFVKTDKATVTELSNKHSITVDELLKLIGHE